MENIPVFKPLISQDEINAATQALEMGWLGMGSYVGEFEERINQYLASSDRYAVAISTGHAALHLGLLIAGVGQGDEVISPSFNNIADFQAILATGAKPVFCDIDNDTLCIDLEQAETLITSRTKAIIVMDYGCRLCNHTQINQFASQHHLRVIHDAAHSFGSKYQGKIMGSFSDICMFSFDPVKTITCIDGGMLIVKTQEEVKRLHEMRLIGMGQRATDMYHNQRAWTYEVQQIGYRYHMANLHAAIGLAQLNKMADISRSRRKTCRFYNERLCQIPDIIVPNTDFTDVTPFLYYIRVPKTQREKLRAFLQKKGIDTGIHWQPGHSFSLFKDCRHGDLSVTTQISQEILSLPLHSNMRIDSMERIVESIISFFS